MCAGSSTQTIACNTEACLSININRAECQDGKVRVEADIAPMSGVTWVKIDFGTGLFAVGFGSDGRVRTEVSVSSCPVRVQMTTNKGGWAESAVENKN